MLIVTSNKTVTSERNMTIFEHFHNAIATAKFHCHLPDKKYQRALFRPCVAVINVFQFIYNKSYLKICNSTI